MTPDSKPQFRFDSEKSPAPEFIDLSKETLERAHFSLGQMYRSQIQDQLKKRLTGIKKTDLESELDLMRTIKEKGLKLSQQLQASPYQNRSEILFPKNR